MSVEKPVSSEYVWEILDENGQRLCGFVRQRHPQKEIRSVGIFIPVDGKTVPFILNEDDVSSLYEWLKSFAERRV